MKMIRVVRVPLSRGPRRTDLVAVWGRTASGRPLLLGLSQQAPPPTPRAALLAELERARAELAALSMPAAAPPGDGGTRKGGG